MDAERTSTAGHLTEAPTWRGFEDSRGGKRRASPTFRAQIEIDCVREVNRFERAFALEERDYLFRCGLELAIAPGNAGGVSDEAHEPCGVDLIGQPAMNGEVVNQ